MSQIPLTGGRINPEPTTHFKGLVQSAIRTVATPLRVV